MLILNEASQRAFLKILYTIMIQDKILTDEEVKTLELIAKEIFKLDDYEETNLKTVNKTASEFDKIKSETAVISLAELLVYFAKKSKEKDVLIFLKQVFENIAISEDTKKQLLSIS